MSLHHPLYPLMTRLATMARETVWEQLDHSTAEERSQTTGHAGSDVIYAIDRKVEERLVDMLEEEAGSLGGIVLIAEGIGEDEITFYPKGTPDATCRWRLLVDPIDGTRGIMMDKRSAWLLAGAAPNKGSGTCLSDIDCAIMGELPTSRSAFADTFAAVRGHGVQGTRTTRDLSSSLSGFPRKKIIIG